jgi:hypothetical protein
VSYSIVELRAVASLLLHAVVRRLARTRGAPRTADLRRGVVGMTVGLSEVVAIGAVNVVP